jgi:hypothetical protein
MPEMMTEKHLVEELGACVRRDVEGTPDMNVLIRATGWLATQTLSRVIRASPMLADDLETFLAQWCATVTRLTIARVREEDAEGPDA